MNSAPRKYWIVSQLFYPDETSTGFVMTKIAEQILNIGEVNVICGSASYHSEALSNALEIDERIKIHRVNSPSWNKNNLFLRILGFVIVTISLSWKILFKVKKDDTIILVTNPPTLVILVAMIKKIKRFRMFIILHDIFPENLAVTGIISRNSFLYKVLLKLFNCCYNQADHLIACGSDMKDIFTSKVRSSMPISVITNWADHKDVYPQSIDRDEYFEENFANKIVLEFAGNIGRVQGLDRFMEVFLKVDHPLLAFVIIGDGAFKDKLLEMKPENYRASVKFIDSKPRSEQNRFLNACDIGLVTLSEGMYGLGVPSKVYNIFAAGKPVLYIGDYNSEVSRYITEHKIGWAFTWDDLDKIELFLKNLNMSDIDQIKEKGIHARLVVENKFTKSLVLEQYNNILQNY
ncbi:MAG: glycosyltransferase family 4 protein [Candidatus Pedobacter colombiensis]|uniref:Glycosyltransferase family 4 protein n=1 Tax=Candidatus Pedobacter colombiensis TaxID=3121371 RepID=A0AAJ6B7A3_9SPHI|nr:glycosyltransferase family 4 protein [Pedobacter sp.]WEK19684.1 MAG: glycosyltransferase family 4 protein [Pedobacter sp.]